MTTTVEPLKPPRTTLGVWGWLRRNLFGSWTNALLTVLSLWLIFVFLKGFIRWAVTEARWGVVTENLRLFMVGQFPPDQMWRVGACVLSISLLFGLSWGVWGGVLRSFAMAAAAAMAVLALVPFDLSVRLWLVGNVALIVGGFGVGRRLPRPRWSRWLLVGWLLSLPAIYLLLRGVPGLKPLPPINTNLWGGLLLTLILSVVGIVASMPLGILLALGRRSELPVVRTFSVVCIEVVRGVPLVTVLFMASIIFPLFMPENIHIDRLWRVMAGIILFSAAYNAENVRGGLQAIPEGQVEAARALGMNGLQVTFLIVLPQALRLVIPATVGQFISLFKDTSLVGIAGLFELLYIGKAVLAQPAWLGRQQEVYIFVAIIYFIFSYAMSYASLRLEAALGVGER